MSENQESEDLGYGRLVRVEFELNTRELAEEWFEHLTTPMPDGMVRATWKPGDKVSVRIL